MFRVSNKDSNKSGDTLRVNVEFTISMKATPKSSLQLAVLMFSGEKKGSLLSKSSTDSRAEIGECGDCCECAITQDVPVLTATSRTGSIGAARAPITSQ